MSHSQRPEEELELVEAVIDQVREEVGAGRMLETEAIQVIEDLIADE